MMISRGAAAGLLAVGAASFATGCGEDGPTGGPALTMPPMILFMTPDLSTGVRVASIRIGNYSSDVPLDVVNALAAHVRVSTWPGDVQAPASQTVSSSPAEQLPNGGQRAGYGQIDVTLDANVDGNGWYAISMPQRRTDDYQVSNSLLLSTFAGDALGIRISPAHPPVLAAMMSCPKDGGTVAVYASFSEPVTKPSGALALDYGAPATSCTVGDDQPSVTQFICANAIGAAPFSLRIADTITATASGAPMAAETLRSADMQSAVLGDGCSYYRPASAD